MEREVAFADMFTNCFELLAMHCGFAHLVTEISEAKIIPLPLVLGAQILFFIFLQNENVTSLEITCSCDKRRKMFILTYSSLASSISQRSR